MKTVYVTTIHYTDPKLPSTVMVFEDSVMAWDYINANMQNIPHKTNVKLTRINHIMKFEAIGSIEDILATAYIHSVEYVPAVGT